MAEGKRAGAAGQDHSGGRRRHDAGLGHITDGSSAAAGQRVHRLQLGRNGSIRRGAQRSPADQCQGTQTIAGPRPPNETPRGWRFFFFHLLR